MLFRVLGPLEVEVDGSPTSVPGARPRALLTALLLRPKMVVPAHDLAEALWGDRLPRKVDNALHQVVARLRTALGDLGEVVVTRSPGYVAIVEESSIDAWRFETHCQAARTLSSDDPASALGLLDQALALWRGPAYGEFADEFARPAATRLEELRLAALEDRAELLMRCGTRAQAVAAARDLAGRQPLRERPVEVLMRALHAAGRPGEALEAFQRHRELVSDELGLDPTPGLRELEARILREDLEPPEALVQVPQAPARPLVRNLPWRPSPLVGREDELQLLLESVASRRLVTVVGPGGVGKTRLALEVAHELVDDGRPVWWADLTVVSPGRVVDALAEATGAEITRADAAGSLCAALAAHRGVLVLDNAEHLLEPLAPVVERLVDAAPGIVVFSTSRERLALDRESVRALGPLPVPADADRGNAAVQLFADRAPGLELDALTDDDVAVVAETCRRLDGLPLAIELGAARAAAFGVHELAAHLGERLDLLAGGRRTAAKRHRTLRAVVDWSHELLTADEARLFARLAVFPGGFSLDQVQVVLGDEQLPRAGIAALLARLVEQSLLQAGQGRFWLLETLRTYAEERLDASGKAGSLRERHARDTAQRLARLDGQLWTSDEAAAVAGLTELVVDLHAAWAYALDHDRTVAVQLAADVYDFAYLRQRLDLLEWGVQVASWDIDHPKRLRALAAAAAAAWATGRLDEAWEYAVAAGDEHPEAGRALQQSGNLAMFKGRNNDAMSRFRAAAELHRKGGEPVRALLDDISVEQARTFGGQAAEAMQHMEDLVARTQPTECPSALCWAYYVAGLATESADADRALTAYAAAIEHGNKADSRLLVMLARSYSVALAARNGPAARALQEFRQIIGQWEQLGNELAHWWILLHLVVLLARTSADVDAAILGGAVLAARGRYPTFGPEIEQLEQALASVRGRLGASATEEALAEGAGLTYSAAVAHARQAIRAAQQRFPH